MVKKRVCFIILVLGLAVLTACQPARSATPEASTPAAENLSPEKIFALGDVSDDPAGTIEAFQPLADYLAAHLAEVGIRQGKVVVAPDLKTMMDYMQAGQVDLYFESPYGALTVYQDIGAVPLARRWKGGIGEYYSIIVARRDSGVTDLDGLEGQMIIFEDPESSSGYMLPKGHLVELGYQLAEKAGADAAVADGEIGYIFAGQEENVMAWLLQGKAAAAALPCGNYEELAPDEQNQLVVLTKTVAIPRHIVMARPGMDAALQAQLIDLLLDMHKTPEGQAVLESFESTSQFDALPLGAEQTMKTLLALFGPVR